MIQQEHIRFAARALNSNRLRTGLMLTAMAIGVAAVVVLTALGEGTRRFVTGEFSALGTNLLIVLPGATETTGGPPPLFGVTPRDLTLDDAMALLRGRHISKVAPIVIGTAPVSFGSREREVVAIGSTDALLSVRHMALSQGRFLPPGDPDRGRPVAVLGDTVRAELFGTHPAVGKWIRLGDRRFRVIGTLAASGQSLGTNLDDMVVIPVSQAQALLNAPSLFRVLVQARTSEEMAAAREEIKTIIASRHDGEADVTVITQDAVMGTFDRVLSALTYAVGGIAGISLVVAGILVMNVMLVAVSRRTAEIGLLKALGAGQGTVMRLFLTEAALLSMLGAFLGLAVGALVVEGMGRMWPGFPVAVPLWAVVAAVGVSVSTGLLFGVWPARTAARLDPVVALSRR